MRWRLKLANAKDVEGSCNDQHEGTTRGIQTLNFTILLLQNLMYKTVNYLIYCS